MENDALQKLKIRSHPTSPEDKIVALYYDEVAKERQELIVLNLFDVSLKAHLDKHESERAADMSVLNDHEVLNHLIATLESLHASASSTKGISAEQKVRRAQLTILILKSINNMIALAGRGFITKIQEAGLLEKLLAHIFLLQETQKTDQKMIPLEWTEIKQSLIKRIALENDVSLVPN